MRKQDVGFDYDRYHRLLVEAVDENKRLALIELLIEEKAMDRLAAQRASDRAAMTAFTIASVLGATRTAPLLRSTSLARSSGRKQRDRISKTLERVVAATPLDHIAGPVPHCGSHQDLAGARGCLRTGRAVHHGSNRGQVAMRAA